MRNLPAIVALVAAASVGCSIDVRSNEASVREEKRFTLAGNEPVELTLRTFDGAIQVKSWDRNEVLVEIERRAPDEAAAEAMTVNTSQEGNRITVEATQPRDRSSVTFGNWVSRAVHLTVTAPRRVALEVRTGDGSIDVDDLEGAIVLGSGDGRILASRVEGQVTARTGDGSIRIDEAMGQVEADSGDGSIEIAGRLTGLTVRTGDGSVSVDAFDGSVLKTDWSITTGDGRVSVRVPERFDAEIDAHTSDGSIRVDGISPSGDRDESDRRTFQTRLGSGGGVLRLRSSDGSIDVSRR